MQKNYLKWQREVKCQTNFTIFAQVILIILNVNMMKNG